MDAFWLAMGKFGAGAGVKTEAGPGTTTGAGARAVIGTMIGTGAGTRTYATVIARERARGVKSLDPGRRSSLFMYVRQRYIKQSQCGQMIDF